MPEHTCHAEGCTQVVPPRMFMCRRHWRMIPKRLQDQLWAVYVPGQETRKNPTSEYLDIAFQLVNYVADKEGRALPFPKHGVPA